MLEYSTLYKSVATHIPAERACKIECKVEKPSTEWMNVYITIYFKYDVGIGPISLCDCAVVMVYVRKSSADCCYS